MQLSNRLFISNGQHVRLTPLPGLRVERIVAVVIGERGFAGFRIGLNTDFAVLQHVLKRVAQERQRQAARPVDIEMAGVTAFFAVFNHIAPPGVFQRRRHMVGHDIEDQPQPGGFERLHHAVKALAPADGRLDFISVGHVITVGGAGGGGKHRRRVQMADAKPLQIRHQARRAVKRHAVAKLNAVR